MTEIVDPPVLVPASLGKRAANYFIDFVLLSFILAMLLPLVAPYYPLYTKIMKKQPIDLSDQLMLSFAYGLYMSITEALLRGKSIGKLITGTRAVSYAGHPINSQTAFLRGLLRLIPLEPLSAIPILFGLTAFPLHDLLSKTHVIDEAKSALPPAE